MSRNRALAAATAYFDDGRFFQDLSSLVAVPSESKNPARRAELRAYLTEALAPRLEALGFACQELENPVEERLPALLATRWEGDDLPTVLTYGHGDVVPGMDRNWREGLEPWRLTVQDGRWYGRGAADNKGQHLINLGGLAAVLAARGRLGFNVKVLVETGEESGSPGLKEIIAANKDRLKADVLIASDGPRLRTDLPTIYGGNRGGLGFSMTVDLREGAHHSGNWGGLLANPGVILAHAIACLVSPTGEVLVPEIRIDEIPNSVRRALKDLSVGDPSGPAIDHYWGQPGLSLAEKVFASNTFEVLAFLTGDPQSPANAIPPKAVAFCQIRFVVGKDASTFLPAIRRRLDEQGFGVVKLAPMRKNNFKATRLDPDDPWFQWAARSVEKTLGRKPALLPNTGGSLPNDLFADDLGLPTLWVPHSYPACSQHAPDEHLLPGVAREGLTIMAGLFWDLGEGGKPA